MSTLVVYSDTTDGFLTSEDSEWNDGEGYLGGDYAAARAGLGVDASGNPAPPAANTASSTASIGQYRAGPFHVSHYYYAVYQSFLSFDTSSVGSGSTVSAVVLNLTSDYDSSITDFIIEARLFDWGTTLTTADWVTSPSGTLLAHYGTASGWGSASAHDFVDDAFPANVNKVGSTRLLLNSSRQVSNTSPTGAENVGLLPADYGGTTSDPQLTVTYAAGGGSVAPWATAYNSGLAVFPAPAVATAAATALDSGKTIAVNVGHATASATAFDPVFTATTATNVDVVQTSAVTATAQVPTAHIQPSGGLATAAATAFDPVWTVTSATNVAVEHATANATAFAPTVLVALPGGLATASATGRAPTANVKPSVGLATANATAFDPTFTTSGDVNVPVGLATANATAYDPTVTGGEAVAGGGGRLVYNPRTIPVKKPVPPVFVSIRVGHATAQAWAHQPGFDWNDDEFALSLLLSA